MLSRSLQALIMEDLSKEIDGTAALTNTAPEPALVQLQQDFFNIVLTDWVDRLELLNHLSFDYTLKVSLILSLIAADPKNGKDEVAKLFCGKYVFEYIYEVFIKLCTENPELGAYVVANNGDFGRSLLKNLMTVQTRKEEKAASLSEDAERRASSAKLTAKITQVLAHLREKHYDFYQKLPGDLKLEEDRMDTHVRRAQDSSSMTAPLLSSHQIQY